MDTPFECEVCLEAYRQPRALLCGHIFCQRCLDNLPSGESGSHCPKCRGSVRRQIRIPRFEELMEFCMGEAVRGHDIVAIHDLKVRTNRVEYLAERSSGVREWLGRDKFSDDQINNLKKLSANRSAKYRAKKRGPAGSSSPDIDID